MAKNHQHHHNNNNDDMARKSSSSPSSLDCCLPMPKPRSDVDYVRESQFLLWLWKMIEEISFSYEYEQYLRDGVILCRLMENVAPDLFNKNNNNDSKPSSKKNFQPSNITIIEKGENKQQKSENIHRFLDACRQYGLNDTELFEVEDLLSMLDMPKVTKCLYRLGQFIAEKNDNKPLLGKPYDEWLNEQIELNEKNIEYFGGSSNIRRRHGMPFGDDLLVSHVSTEFVKQRLNRNVNKDRIRRSPKDPLVQRQPSIPLANLKAIFTGECQPLQYNNNDQLNI